MKVTVFGSISIKRLLAEERQRVLRLVELGLEVLVSDAGGVHLAVQTILAGEGYRNVVVYHKGARAATQRRRVAYRRRPGIVHRQGRRDVRGGRMRARLLGRHQPRNPAKPRPVGVR